MVVGPVTGASLNPARAFGPELVSAIGGGATHWNQLIPVYILPGLVGSALAAFAYDFMPSRAWSRRRSARRSATPTTSATPTRAPRPPRSAERSDDGYRNPATMKKFLNDPADLVRESLAGLAAAHGDILRYDADAQIVVRAGAPVQGKVALVSGGGSGHEPLHGGFVGLGMLDAACPGEVFTSPVPDQMLAATKAVDGGAGVVHIVKNYTGDVMNFKLAAEDAADEGIDVESVLVDDDVAVQDSLYTAGRRGVGATVLLEKIAGAAAERGDDLAAVAGDRAAGERARALVRRRAVVVHAAGGRAADLRPARRRGRDRHRHPRRAGPPARGARHRARARRA